MTRQTHTVTLKGQDNITKLHYQQNVLSIYGDVNVYISNPAWTISLTDTRFLSLSLILFSKPPHLQQAHES